jgi:hypothetical protein
MDQYDEEYSTRNRVRLSYSQPPHSQSLPIYLPNIQHPRPLPCRETRITRIGRVVHVVVDRIWPTISLWSIRVGPSGAVIACWDTAIGTGIFACRAASYVKRIVSMILRRILERVDERKKRLFGSRCCAVSGVADS